MKLAVLPVARMRVCTLTGRQLSTAAAAATAAVASANPETTTTNTMPPGFTASVGRLETFFLPEKVSGSVSDCVLASAMVNTWRKDGIIQIAMTRAQQMVYEDANAESKSFFGRRRSEKAACVDGRSYSGYIASGEEITDGVADYSEIFTVTKDVPSDDLKARKGWPCHGSCPWPDVHMKGAMERYMEQLSDNGETLLQLIELGLDVPEGSLTRYTRDGWHHMRILR